MNRLEIIAAIDAEIERLQHARLLVAQSAVKKAPRSSGDARGRRSNIEKKKSTRRLVQRPVTAQPAAIKLKPQVVVIRIASKEQPKPRIRTATKSKKWSALTKDVPQGPIAVPAPSREAISEATHSTAVPTSAFGLAITRELAATGAEVLSQ